MTAFACPKCRGALPDAAIDAGACAACGFPLDGPLPALAPRRSARPYLLGALALLAAGACAALFLRSEPGPDRAPHVARADPAPPTPKREVAVAPLPRELVSVAPQPHEPRPEPGPKIEPKLPAKPGAVVVVDPLDARERRIDNADAEVRVPDLHGEEELVLRGTARVLKIGSIHGRVRVDASKLNVREVIVAGDLHGDAALTVSAPNGSVTVNGFVIGSAKLTVLAPGGAVLFAESARLDGGSAVTVTARAVTVRGPMLGGTKLGATLTSGGALKLNTLEGGATVTYRKEKPTDPAPVVEPGTARGGARVIAE